MTAPGCPNPARCPVPDPAGFTLSHLRFMTVPAASRFHSVFRTGPFAGPFAELGFNSSRSGDARFSPLPLDSQPVAVPVLYLARSRVAALLETVFHDITPDHPRTYPASFIAGRGLRTVEIREPLRLVDFRDDALARSGLHRSEIAATSAAHYPCTRQWAVRVRESQRTPQASGIIWRSRLTEIAQADSLLLDDMVALSATDVVVVFGDRITPNQLAVTTEYDDLAHPDAAALIDAVTNELQAIRID